MQAYAKKFKKDDRKSKFWKCYVYMGCVIVICTIFSVILGIAGIVLAATALNKISDSDADS